MECSAVAQTPIRQSPLHDLIKPSVSYKTVEYSRWLPYQYPDRPCHATLGSNKPLDPALLFKYREERGAIVFYFTLTEDIVRSCG